MIKPILVLKLSIKDIPYAEVQYAMKSTSNKLKFLNDDYHIILLPTYSVEHSVELLNPNLITEEESEKHMLKLEELQKTLDAFLNKFQNEKIEP